MIRKAWFSIMMVACVVLGAGRAEADHAGERAAVADGAIRLSVNASALAKTARDSDDRAVRRTFGPRAMDLADDLTALARRAQKDVPLQAIAKDALALGRDAAELVDLADEAEEKEERKSLRAQAQVIAQGITNLRKQVEAYAARTEERRPPPPVRGPAPMTPDAFKALLAAIDDASFDDGKIQIVRQAAQGNYFTTQQVGAIMEEISFEDGKIDAAVACWNRIVDPNNRFALFGKLTFDSSKQKLRQRVGG